MHHAIAHAFWLPDLLVVHDFALPCFLVCNQTKFTLLHYAAKSGCLPIVSLLLDEGADSSKLDIVSWI